MRTLLAPLFLFLATSSVQASVFTTTAVVFQEVTEAEDLSVELEAIRAEAGAPGLVAVAVQDGAIVAWGVAGVRAHGSEVKLELQDPMHLGSCGKAMTSTLMARLVEEGTLSFETTIAEALPDFAQKIDEGYHDVTIDMLIRHRGGIAERRREETEAVDLAVYGRQGAPAEARLKILEQVLSMEPLPPAEGAFDYSNFGYMIVGAIAEAATGKTWEELMVEKVFRPLEMTSAGTGSPVGAGVPVGHTPVEGGFKALPPGPEGILPACMGPAGLVHSNLVDWGKSVSARSLPRCRTPSVSNYLGKLVPVAQPLRGSDSIRRLSPCTHSHEE